MQSLRVISVGLVLLATVAGLGLPAGAEASATLSGAGIVGPVEAGEDGRFAFPRVPLRRNSVNTFTVTATDDAGNEASQSINITQVSLEEVAVAEVHTERLEPDRVEELVNAGVIDLDDPENYNVSSFEIVLAFERREVPIETYVVTPRNGDVPPDGWETYRLPQGDQPAGRQEPQIQVIIFEEDLDEVAEVTGYSPPPLPGVIIIEGDIRSLREFFAVRLLLMNTSGIFKLTDIQARLEFPEGGLSSMLPDDGVIEFDDILPGAGGAPGQREREFIVRGDEIGVRPVRVTYGGLITGPGIPEDAPIPFSGAAQGEVEVLGPPEFLVRVQHPGVISGPPAAGEPTPPYELAVDITNNGQLPALYASLETAAGGDVMLVAPELDAVTGEIVYREAPGSEIRALGHMLPGNYVRETFLLQPREGVLQPGEVADIACGFAVADQNITLQVAMGDRNALVGVRPIDFEGTDGDPSVMVLPSPNALGVGIASPVVAFFSELMREPGITTGDGGSFNVYAGDEILPGNLALQSLNGKTVALWRFEDGITNRLAPDTNFTVRVRESIADLEGNRLASGWESEFRTTNPLLDQDPPQLTAFLEPPTDAAHVLPGEILHLNAYAADQGSGVARFELFTMDPMSADPAWALIDQKTIFEGDSSDAVFAVDTAAYGRDQAHHFRVRAYDRAQNAAETTLPVYVAASADPPTITLRTPDTPVPQGIRVPLRPAAISLAVREVRYYLDGGEEPEVTARIAPWSGSLPTLTLPIGEHSVRAVAEDVLGQTGEDTMTFDIADNPNPPTVSFSGAADGAVYALGTTVVVRVNVSDPVGVASVAVSVDGAKQTAAAEGSFTVSLDTDQLGLGDHSLRVTATNALGVSNAPDDPDAALSFTVVDPPQGPAPSSPVVTLVSVPEDGWTTVSGSSAPGAHIEVVNTSLGFSWDFHCDGEGSFTGRVEAVSGDILEFVAHDYTQSQLPSATVTAVVPADSPLVSISVSPETLAFSAALGETAQLTVTGHREDDSTMDLTPVASYMTGNASVAGVNEAGVVAAVGNGETDITVMAEGYTVTVHVTVTVVVLSHITVAPSSVAFQTLGQTQQLAVTRHYSDGSSSVAESGVSYLSSDPAVARVASSGLLTAVGEGAARITVYLPGAEPVFVEVSVETGEDPPPTAEITAPASGAGVQRGDVVTVQVHATDSLGGVRQIDLRVTGETAHEESAQISPAEADVTRTFSFTVAADAVIGGAIELTAWSTDTLGQTSSVAAITLYVVDETAPAVEVLLPEPNAAYESGDFVDLSIRATDDVGVVQIRFETEGAVSASDSSAIQPAESPAEAAFSFRIPFSVADPAITIRAYARDAAGNEGAATPVPIVVADADAVPPETRATAVADPSGGATALVSYEVLSGLEDLDHVALYFRRDGFGTYNRFTDAAGGNALGEFSPQNGAVGTIAFDSTRMGGDGAYEFYTVGVDAAGNREPAPDDGEGGVIPDQATAFSAGTVWTTIDADAAIGSDDATYDGLNLRVDGALVTLEGLHRFQNVELLNGAVLTHPQTTLDEAPGLQVQAWTITIDSGSAIRTDGCGYLGGRHAENGDYDEGRTLDNQLGSTYRSGGGYGGPGAVHGEGVTNAVYGNLTDPIEAGSGGSAGSSSVAGGDGGGTVLIEAINLVNDGAVSANGESGHGNGAGSGSGGAIKLVVSTVSGAGPIRCNGGAYEVGGGGGRVAIFYVDVATLDISLVQALGGVGSWAAAGDGTVFMKGVDEGDGTLVFDGQGTVRAYSTLPIPPGLVFDNIIIRNSARVLLNDPVTVNDSFQVLSGSVVSHGTSQEEGVVVLARNVYVDATSAMDASGRGYRGGRAETNESDEGLTLGGVAGSTYRAGGSYGGYGAVHGDGRANPPYGLAAAPDYLGAGGSVGSSGVAGGNGGGRLRILAEREVVIDGAVRANGSRGGGNGAGSGSGGSILIETSMLRGTGWISANGAAYEVGGGGGRVSIVYEALGGEGEDFDGLRRITAFGGHGAWAAASAGTVHLRQLAQVGGDLYVDAGVEGSTAPHWTPLTRVGPGMVAAVGPDTLTVDGEVPMVPGGLVGLELNPNVAQTQTYTIVANTASTITVDTSGLPALDTVSEVGDTYAGVNRFDNVYFRRGGFLVLGDPIIVGGAARIEEYGRLDHHDSTLTYVPGLDLTVGALYVGPTGSINVSGRGYLGGLRPGNGESDSGRTLGNDPGSSMRSGGAHGGRGAAYDGTPNTVYGDPADPRDLGSGGSAGTSGVAGGDGGGRMSIVADSIEVQGVIASNGSQGGGNGAGSGSGGSINVRTGSLTGDGYILASGAAREVGGGGGRVAVRYQSMTLDESHIEVLGGRGSWASAGNGTLFLKQNSAANGDLIVDGAGLSTPAESTVIGSDALYDNVILRSGARVVADQPVSAVDEVRLLAGSVLTHSLALESGLWIEAARVLVDDTSAIDVSGRGYPGGATSTNAAAEGLTLGGLPGATMRSGGSYGGYGGQHDGQTNPVYGHPAAADLLGSGGSGGTSGTAGGHGGGRITILANDAVEVYGTIAANGWSGAGNGAGSGSGGSIAIATGVLSGTGWITANGAAYEVGGGGGRVVIDYESLGETGSDLDDTRNVVAFGGHGSWAVGSAGTVLLRSPSQTHGDLLVDDGVTNGTAPNWTPLTRIGHGSVAGVTADTLTVDGYVALLPNGLVGIEVNPNTSQDQTYIVVSNTEDTITVDLTGRPGLTAVAQAGDRYAGVYRFDNVFFRRGGYLVTGDQIRVTGWVMVDEYGRLDHFPATTAYECLLDLTAAGIHVLETGAINVSARGYLGGRSGTNTDFEEGRTLGNALGSTYRAGGSHGGSGAAHGDGVPCPVYGEADAPLTLGAGGSAGSSSVAGGSGGGVARITADTVQVDGTILAGGGVGRGNGAGSGAGGSINLTTNALSGSGSIRADGAAYEVGGGGGRVAIRYEFSSSDLANLDIGASGGAGSWAQAADGTVELVNTE